MTYAEHEYEMWAGENSCDSCGNRIDADELDTCCTCDRPNLCPSCLHDHDCGG
jgi:hypothetical protein